MDADRFRWAVCQLDTLCSCVTLPQLRKALQSLPKDLDSTYERILCDIDDTSFAYALKMLRWLTFSARPLFLEEMIEVIAIDVHDDPRFDPERRLPDSRDIMTICSSLITLDAETIAPNHPSISLTPVKLAHFSVKEYLVSDRIRIGKASRYSIREDESDAIIAEDCLAYLLDIDGAILRTREEAITGRISTDFLTAKHQREYPLALYAAEYWTLQAQAAEESDTTETSSLVVELLRSESAAFENWVRIYESGGELFTYTMDDSNYQNDNHLSTEELCRFARSPLHYTSFIGLVKSVRILLEQGYDVNATVDITPGAVSALGAACMGCHMLIVRILLDNGALVNPDKASITSPPLCQASYWGHEEVVRLLLDNGADVNAQTADGSSALQYAFQGEHRGVVQQLLDNGADVNAQGGRYDSALQAASLEGDIETLQLLIEKGANVNAVNAQSNFYGTALYTVSSQGLKEVAQLLIEKGADVNIQAGHYGNALQAASHKGAIETVKLLIEKGANVNAYHSYWGTALQTASYEGSKELALMLIEKGADINARGGIWGRALSAAVAGRSLDVVQLLIVNGADVNAYGEYWRNPLRAAARKGDSEIVQILLDNGAIEVDE
jgi:ankyrin repeat protein